jgi:hypothetical protein
MQQISVVQNNNQCNSDVRNPTWGTAPISNIEILERFQSKALRMAVDAPWFVLNTVIRRDLQTPTAKEEIRH